MKVFIGIRDVFLKTLIRGGEIRDRGLIPVEYPDDAEVIISDVIHHNWLVADVVKKIILVNCHDGPLQKLLKTGNYPWIEDIETISSPSLTPPD